MTFTYRVYYEDNSWHSYGKIRCKLVRSRSPEKAIEKFRKKFGAEPMYVR